MCYPPSQRELRHTTLLMYLIKREFSNPINLKKNTNCISQLLPDFTNISSSNVFPHIKKIDKRIKTAYKIWKCYIVN